MGMTWQYVAGESSVLPGHLQAAARAEASQRDVWSLRHAAETGPIQAPGWMTVHALAPAEGLCRDPLNRGDATAFACQAACAGLHESGVCAGLLKEAQAGLLRALR